MIEIDGSYTNYRDDTDPRYPYGKAVPTSTSKSTDGTPWRATWFNDLIGSRQAIFVRAFGKTGRQPSNTPDNAEQSDILDALLHIMKNSFSLQLFSLEVSGIETIIPWTALDISYDVEKNYAAIVTVSGNYEEFLPFGAECKTDGLHIFSRRLINGKIVSGTRKVKWGTRKWGIGKWNDFDTIRVNLQFQEIR